MIAIRQKSNAIRKEERVKRSVKGIPPGYILEHAGQSTDFSYGLDLH